MRKKAFPQRECPESRREIIAAVDVRRHRGDLTRLTCNRPQLRQNEHRQPPQPREASTLAMRRESSFLSDVSLELDKMDTEEDIIEVNASKSRLVEEYTTTRFLHEPSEQTGALRWRDSGHSTLVADATVPRSGHGT